MVLPGHLAAGFIVAKLAISVVHPSLSTDEVNLLLLLGMVAGDLPDLDVAYHFLKRKTSQPEDLGAHRHYVTHAPIVWLLAGAVIYFLSSNDFFRMIGLFVWLGPWAHLLGDSIEYGVMWLWPFSTKRYALLGWHEPTHYQRTTYWGQFWEKYSRTTTFKVEILLVIIAFLVLLA